MTNVTEELNDNEFICVICPNSCRLTVIKQENGELTVEGNQCKRGLEYGIQEYTSPMRMLITTMRIKNGTLPVIPVRSDKEIPREKMFEAIKLVNESKVSAPVKMGDIILENILGTGANVIASRSMEAICYIKTPGNDVKEFICVICPNSCRLTVYKDKLGELHVEGNQCKRGLEYGMQEYTMPKRMLITTMRISNGTLPVIPVRSDKEIPREKMFNAMEIINMTKTTAPIKMGEKVIENLLGLDVNVIASRSMGTKS